MCGAIDRGMKFVFLQCGRKYGKTVFLHRKLLEHCLLPTNNGIINFHCVYEKAQAKKILWIPKVPFKLCNPRFIKKYWETEMRIEFINGKQLIVDGADNYKAHEGTEPAALCIDELKNCNPMFWEAVEPNLAVYDAWTIFAGSPPGKPSQYREIRKMVQQEEEHGRGLFVQHPSWMNNKVPGLIPWLKRAQARYKARGEEYLFLREFAARDEAGGKRRVYPNEIIDVSNENVWVPREHIKEKVKNPSHFDWLCIADPSSGGAFAMLALAIDKTSKHIYIVDCFKQTNRALTGCHAIWDQTQAMLAPWMPNLDAWHYIYDDHEAWFPIEMLSVQGAPAWTPSGKQTTNIQAGVSLIKDAFLLDCVLINDELESLKEEFVAYETDEYGTPQRTGNDLLDCFRYGLYYLSWDSNEVVKEPIPDHIKDNPYLMMAYREENQIGEKDLMNDWLADMYEDFISYG